jgi:ATP-binding cassette subfamily B (MDR/TAP) protein 7
MALLKIVGDSLVLRTRTKGFSWSRHVSGVAAACSGTDFAQTPFLEKRYNRVRCRYSPMSYPVTAATSCRWNSSDSSNASASDDEKKSAFRIPKTLAKHVWPSDDSAESKQRKKQVVLALSLMLAGKGVTIQVPFIFKSLVDTLQIDATNAIETAATLTPATLDLTTMTTAAGIPVIAVLMGYGMSRAAASGFQELRNAVFANVTQQAIRKVGRSVFQHVQTLDMQFHLSKNTGKVSRILDRGNRSISFVLNAMVFHAAPTTVEVGLVTGLVYYQFGLSHASVVLGTIATYTAFTAGITQWRTKFRRDMNRLENQASSRVVDSLVNYETVQFFNNLPHEV